MLVVEDLKTYYPTSTGEVKAVDGVSFKLQKGATLGIAGESGCGKSTLGYSLLNLVPTPGRIVDSRIYVDGEEITRLPNDRLREIRWETISMVFQGAMNSLNPVYSIGRQMEDTVRVHKSKTEQSEAKQLSRKSLEMVRLSEDVLKRYPHELSGGMKQRVVIAMALMLEPKILIADEPTTALDVVVQAQIINLLKDLQKKLNMSVILITHDLSLIPELSDKVAIMYAGQFANYGVSSKIYSESLHPYTHLLLDSIPTLSGDKRLTYISGAPPDLRIPPSGCRFHPRCPYVVERCKVEKPTLRILSDEQYVACHRAEEALW